MTSLAPLAAGAVMAIIGIAGVMAGVPWLFPSLGPTIAIQAETPEAAVAKPWNVIVGHFIGAAVGIACVRLTTLAGEPPVNVSLTLSATRVAAAAFAVFASMALQRVLKARHPPAQATTLLVVMGALASDLRGAFVLLAGILLVAALGEVVRRWRMPAG